MCRLSYSISCMLFINIPFLHCIPSFHRYYIQVIIELVIGLLLILTSQTLSLKLKPIRLSANIRAKSYEEATSNYDYIIFNHRGRYYRNQIS